MQSFALAELNVALKMPKGLARAATLGNLLKSNPQIRVRAGIGPRQAQKYQHIAYLKKHSPEQFKSFVDSKLSIDIVASAGVALRKAQEQSRPFVLAADYGPPLNVERLDPLRKEREALAKRAVELDRKEAHINATHRRIVKLLHDNQRGLAWWISKQEWRKLKGLLHPDRARPGEEKQYTEAFTILMKLEEAATANVTFSKLQAGGWS